MAEWRKYSDAASRKLQIAYYHFECLIVELSQPTPVAKIPPIPVQAHFEGVVLSTMAAVDQVAQAVNSADCLGLQSNELVQSAFAVLNQRLPAVGIWYDNPLGVDLRRVRVRMAHYSYKKTPQGTVWAVESTGTKWTGARDLESYAKSAVNYGQELNDLMPLIDQAL